MSWHVTFHRDVYTGSLEVFVRGRTDRNEPFVLECKAVEQRILPKGDQMEPLLRIPQDEMREFCAALATGLKEAQFVPDRERELTAELEAARGAKQSIEGFANRTLDILAAKLMQ